MKLLSILALIIASQLALASGEITCHWSAFYMDPPESGAEQLIRAGFDLKPGANSHMVLQKLVVSDQTQYVEYENARKIAASDKTWLGCIFEPINH